MSTKTEKKEEQTPAQPTEETSAIDTAFAPQLYEAASISEQVAELNKQRDEQQKKTEGYLEAMREARQKGVSAFGAFVEKQEPTYDANKEKRMRNAAIIQSLGDVLSAASRGYFAYNKRGAGVVPKVPNSNAFEGVNKISEMQEKYRNEHKAWQDLNLQWENLKNANEVEAARELYDISKSAQDAIDQRIQELRERGIKITDDIRNTITALTLGEYQKDLDMEREKEFIKWQKKNKVGPYAPKKTTSGGGSGYSAAVKAEKAKEKRIMTDYVNIYYARHPYTSGGKIVAFGSLPLATQQQIQEAAKNDPYTQLFMSMVNAGYGYDEVQTKLDKKKDAELIGGLEVLHDIAGGSNPLGLAIIDVVDYQNNHKNTTSRLAKSEIKNELISQYMKDRGVANHVATAAVLQAIEYAGSEDLFLEGLEEYEGSEADYVDYLGGEYTNFLGWVGEPYGLTPEEDVLKYRHELSDR